MTARLGALVTLARYASILLLAAGLPARATAQAPVRDTTSARAAVKDLPLTAAQRQAFVGTYSVTLPQGEQTSLRILEENGALKARPDNQDETPRLLYQGDNVFLVEGVPDFTFTFVVESGRATRFTARKADGLVEGVRVR